MYYVLWQTIKVQRNALINTCTCLSLDALTSSMLCFRPFAYFKIYLDIRATSFRKPWRTAFSYLCGVFKFFSAVIWRTYTGRSKVKRQTNLLSHRKQFNIIIVIIVIIIIIIVIININICVALNTQHFV